MQISLQWTEKVPRRPMVIASMLFTKFQFQSSCIEPLNVHGKRKYLSWRESPLAGSLVKEKKHTIYDDFGKPPKTLWHP